LSETLVWLDPVSVVKARKAESAQIVTRSKTLLPHIAVVPVGSTVRFPNEDPILHNLFSISAPNSFDLGLYRRNSGKSQKFDAPGVVNIYCNVHPGMSAVLHVMSSPYYGFADSAGNFTLADVPAGRYRLMAWNELGGSTQQPVEVTASGEVRGTTTVTLDGKSLRATQHLNKFGQPYSRSNTNDY
jgi:plastocyanin